jgi:3-hydroxyisobutyrate dehydrogenase-like beta-hydroxyacid dehydrogenase
VKESARGSCVADHDMDNILDSNDDETFTLELCCKDLRLINELGSQLRSQSPLGGEAEARFRRDPFSSTRCKKHNDVPAKEHLFVSDPR